MGNAFIRGIRSAFIINIMHKARGAPGVAGVGPASGWQIYLQNKRKSFTYM